VPVKRLLLLGALVVLAVPASAARLPILATQDLWPVFAPDGRHVAFTRVNGQGRVYTLEVLDAQTGRVVPIGSNQGQLSPSWSTEGRIAYASGGSLYVVNADGSGKRRYAASQKAVSPAWRPRSTELAYLTTFGATNLDLWVANALWAKGVIGRPAWSPDGSRLAFQRDGGIWVATAPLTVIQVADTNVQPGSPVWSPDGKQIAYSAAGSVYVVAGDGFSAPRRIAGPFSGVGPLAWSPAGDALAYTVAGGVELTFVASPPRSSLLVKGAATGTSFAPTDPQGRVLAYSGPRPKCPGHNSIRLYEGGTLTGSCAIAGTPGPDVIEGTQSWGDQILAGLGNDKIRAGDRHTDTIDCGPGRDEVWADQLDRLSHCEVVHR
jgi:Tol biopolymer transport system component